MNAPSDRESFIEDFAHQEKEWGKSDPLWLTQCRKEAMAEFAHKGIPTPRDENWKYLRLSPFFTQPYSRGANPQNQLGFEALSPFVCESAENLLVFLNGHFVKKFSRLDNLPPSVLVTSLREALLKHEDLLRPYLARLTSLKSNSFAALNTAFIEDGAFIHLPPQVQVKSPIHILYLSSCNGAPQVFYPRNLIVAKEGSHATLIESYVSRTEALYFNNAVTEMKLGCGAHLNHYKVQNDSSKAIHLAGTDLQLSEGSRFDSCSLNFGASLSRGEVNCKLETASTCNLSALLIKKNNQQADFHFRIDHQKPHGLSKIVTKGIFADGSHGALNSRVVVHPGAIKTDAQQLMQNLLLSEEAEVNPKPDLEIYADDVKCSHGATVGQLDEKSLFYLQSRGIDLEIARQILVASFASEIVEAIPFDLLRKRVNSLIESSLKS